MYKLQGVKTNHGWQLTVIYTTNAVGITTICTPCNRLSLLGEISELEKFAVGLGFGYTLCIKCTLATKGILELRHTTYHCFSTGSHDFVLCYSLVRYQKSLFLLRIYLSVLPLCCCRN